MCYSVSVRIRHFQLHSTFAFAFTNLKLCYFSKNKKVVYTLQATFCMKSSAFASKPTKIMTVMQFCSQGKQAVHFLSTNLEHQSSLIWQAFY